MVGVGEQPPGLRRPTSEKRRRCSKRVGAAHSDPLGRPRPTEMNCPVAYSCGRPSVKRGRTVGTADPGRHRPVRQRHPSGRVGGGDGRPLRRASCSSLQVVAPEHLVGAGRRSGRRAVGELAGLAERCAGSRGRARIEYDSAAGGRDRAGRRGGAGRHRRGRQRSRMSDAHAVPARKRAQPRLAHRAVHRGHREHARRQRRARRGSSRGGDGEAEPTEGQLLGRAAPHRRRARRLRAAKRVARRGDRESTEDVRAQRFRRALEELGPTFAKLGQILSTRPDLLPAGVRARAVGPAGPGDAAHRAPRWSR